MARIRWTPRLVRTIANGQYGASLREPRIGVMLHFDGSAGDEGAQAWFADPRCRVSYQLLVLDDGSYVRIAPDTARAWHAGVCRSSDPERLAYQDACSAFYGLCAATDEKTDVTPPQLLTIAWLARSYFGRHGWDVAGELWRVTGHEDEAWPRGRKRDPSGGPALGANPIYTPADIRSLIPLVVL